MALKQKGVESSNMFVLIDSYQPNTQKLKTYSSTLILPTKFQFKKFKYIFYDENDYKTYIQY